MHSLKTIRSLQCKWNLTHFPKPSKTNRLFFSNFERNLKKMRVPTYIRHLKYRSTQKKRNDIQKKIYLWKPENSQYISRLVQFNSFQMFWVNVHQLWEQLVRKKKWWREAKIKKNYVARQQFFFGKNEAKKHNNSEI